MAKKKGFDINLTMDSIYDWIKDDFRNHYSHIKSSNLKSNFYNSFLDNIIQKKNEISFKQKLFEYIVDKQVDIEELYKEMHNVVYNYCAISQLSEQEQERNFFIKYFDHFDVTIKNNYIAYMIFEFLKDIKNENKESIVDRSFYIQLVNLLLKNRKITTFKITEEDLSKNYFDILYNSVERVYKLVMIKGKSLFSNNLTMYVKVNQYHFYHKENNQRDVDMSLNRNINENYSNSSNSYSIKTAEKFDNISDLLKDFEETITNDQLLIPEKKWLLVNSIITNQKLIIKNKETIFSFLKKNQNISIYLYDYINFVFYWNWKTILSSENDLL